MLSYAAVRHWQRWKIVSVLSITHWYCVKINDCRIMQFLPLGSLGTNFFRATFTRLVLGESPSSGFKRDGWVNKRKKSDFSPVNRYISKTIVDRHIVISYN